MIVQAIPRHRPLRFGADSAFALACLLAAMSIAGLASPLLYINETPAWRIQAVAQDWFDLCVAVPALIVAAVLARRGSRPARLALAGIQLFAAYTLAIYCFSMHLNPFFLVYCAAFGLAVYGLGINGAQLALACKDAGLEIRRRATTAILLALVGILFALLWLAQIVPAIQTGRPPRELVETGLVTNPIHVLDLSLILPLHVIAAVAVWKRRWLGSLLAPVVLVFGALMAASIAVLSLYAEAQSPSGAVSIGLVMGALATVSALLGASALRDHTRDSRTNT